MQKITTLKSKLKEVLEKNKADHRAQFEKGLEDYRVAIVGILEDKLRDAKAGKKVEQYIQLMMPEDHTSDYDRALRMLDLEVNDTVELNEKEVAQLVMDDWGWKQQFTVSNSTLAATALSYR